MAVVRSQFSIINALLGPIFGKELRVSSRRRRNYALRFVYLGLMTLFLVLLWLQTMPRGASGLQMASRMAENGRGLTMYVVWFQFVACQILATVMLSTAISDEITHKTLGVLMTTPINSLQIVLGKLASRLLQLILLIAMSLPLLAIVRVFGGVSWNFLLSGLCITLSMAIFVGSLSLLFSIFTRRAYVVILLTILTLGTIYLLVPVLVAIFGHSVMKPQEILSFFAYLNPYISLGIITEQFMSSRGRAWVTGPLWVWQCLIQLGATAILLAVSVVKVRKAALCQMVGQVKTRTKAASASPEGGEVSAHVSGRLSRPLTGCPVLWKELRSPLLGRHKVLTCVAMALAWLVITGVYLKMLSENTLDDADTQIAFVLVFFSIGTLFTMVLPATCITAEKESRSWPILMGTTLGDGRIILGKWAGAIRRCLPAWSFLSVHLAIFAAVGMIHPIGLLHMVLVVTGVIVFLTGSGLYFSSRVRHTTTAVILNFALPAAIWLLIPAVLGISLAIAHSGDRLLELCITFNPFVQTGVIIEACARKGALRSYSMPMGSMDAGEVTSVLFVSAIAYAAVGLWLSARAKGQFRKRIF